MLSWTIIFKENMLSTRKIAEMKPVLYRPEAEGPEEVYYMIRGNPNITVINAGSIGGEYLKTLGHYHKNDSGEIYHVLFGKALFLLQKRVNGQAEHLEDVKIIKADQGDRIEILKGYAHTMINIGNTALVTTDNAPANASEVVNDYEPIKKMGGFAYFIVEDKNNEPSLVKNTNYKTVPNAKLQTKY